jgi:hypothetical protein
LVSVHADERLDYALAATFRTERQLNDWLDGQAKAAVMAGGATLGFIGRRIWSSSRASSPRRASPSFGTASPQAAMRTSSRRRAI